MLGYEDYYDWKVAIAEGQRKRQIFARLEHFLAATAATTRRELDRFAAEHGAEALHPWNFQFLRAGSLSRLLDPHFPIGDAVSRWVRSFGAMNIRFRGATLTLDLIDRAGKYENGFMHGPGIAHVDLAGTWHPARINFTANAVPGAVGAGLTATTTLFHEGGHAAHFANITAGSPCFAHEFPPTSVAYAETQSMFLDSLLGDADWRARYALNAAGDGVPWELVERQIREEQPFKGWDTRRLITVPMGERFLYELPDDALNTERIIDGLRAIERDVQGLSASARPILAVPHLISAESSAYYHAYVLAEMAVQQTRAFFLERDGFLTDNPRIGPDLAEAYWAPGNRVTHDATLVALTGKPLGADAIIADANRSVDEAVAEARRDWERARNEPLPPMPESLDARIRLVHGPEIIADSAGMSLQQVCDAFASWCARHTLEA
jgi:Zn-dependent oligopeptidase